MIFPKDFVNKKILIFGYGKTGQSVKKYLELKNISFSVWDDNKNPRIKNLDKEYYKKKYDFIILSPGVDIYHHKNKVFFKKNKKKIITDLDIFFSSSKKYNYVIGITGTNGKSSFCRLLYNTLKKNKISSKIIGNFGNPVLNVPYAKERFYIIELSSYQLDYSKNLKLDSACILNISPDHLERHITIANYKKIKLKIFKFLKKNGKGFYFKKSFNNLRENSKTKSFNVIDKNLLSKIIGKKISITKKEIEDNDLPHRNEFFYKKKNFKFVNDSKSTNFESTRYAIKKNKNIYLIVGGKLKKGDNFFIKDLASKILKIYVFGNNVNILKKSFLKQKVNFDYDVSLKQVIKNIYKNHFIKNLNKKKNFTLLFSPGAASFDQFKNFEDRGIKFKKYIYDYFQRK